MTECTKRVQSCTQKKESFWPFYFRPTWDVMGPERHFICYCCCHILFCVSFILSLSIFLSPCLLLSFFLSRNFLIYFRCVAHCSKYSKSFHFILCRLFVFHSHRTVCVCVCVFFILFCCCLPLCISVFIIFSELFVSMCISTCRCIDIGRFFLSHNCCCLVWQCRMHFLSGTEKEIERERARETWQFIMTGNYLKMKWIRKIDYGHAQNSWHMICFKIRNRKIEIYWKLCVRVFEYSCVDERCFWK